MNVLDFLRQEARKTEELPAFIEKVERFGSLDQAISESEGRIKTLQEEEKDLNLRVEKRVSEESTKLIEERTAESKANVKSFEIEARTRADAVIAKAEREAQQTLSAAQEAAKQIKSEAQSAAEKDRAMAAASLALRDRAKAELEELEQRLEKARVAYEDFRKLLP